MQRPFRTSSETSDRPLPGVIDTLGVAFIRLAQRPYVILPPLLLDLFLWADLRLPAAPLTGLVERQLRGWGASGPRLADQFGSLADGVNLIDLLGLGVPSLVQGLSGERVAGTQAHWLTGLGWVGTLLAGFGLLALGIALAVLYVTLVGTLVREGSARPAVVARRAWVNLRRIVRFALVTLGLALLLLLPVLVVTAALLVFGIDIVPLAALIVMLAIVGAYVALYFAQDAIVVSDVGALRAMQLSVGVVRRFLWATARFIAITAVIGSGMPLAFSVFARSPYSMPFALVGHAFIATGLVGASMLFYQDRARLVALSSTETTRPNIASPS